MKYSVCDAMPKEALRGCESHLGNVPGLCRGCGIPAAQSGREEPNRVGVWCEAVQENPFNICLFPSERVQPCSHPQSQGSHRQTHRVRSHQDPVRPPLDAGWPPQSKYVRLWGQDTQGCVLFQGCLSRLYVCNPNTLQSL